MFFSSQKCDWATSPHTHTHIPQRVDESSAYYQEQARQAKQIMTPYTLQRLKLQVLSQFPAKVSSTKTQWTLYRGVVERSLIVNQGRHGECLQGNVMCWEIVACLCCGLVVREAVGVASVYSYSNIMLSQYCSRCVQVRYCYRAGEWQGGCMLHHYHSNHILHCV